MTKKHLEAIARILAENRDDGASSNVELAIRELTIDAVATDLANYLGGINPAFDRARFFAACRGEK